MEKEIPVDIYTERLRNMDKIRHWHGEQRAARAITALQEHGFEALYVADREQARQQLLNRIPSSARVGVGGSMTIREIGILESLEAQGNIIYNHWKPGLSQEEILEIRKAHLTCDIFLTSTNALTLEGELVSTDGIGNRICAMTFGPPKVIIVAGINKLVPDIPSAFQRIKNIATPQAIKEADLAVPCIQTGFCGDCNSPQRACRATIILERRPMLTEMLVVLVGETLGF
jgi:L-lactate utilization protein LutB